MALSGSVGSYQEFVHTGGMQSVTIPTDGIYKLEVYGARGGYVVWNAGSSSQYDTVPGKGGYSNGYKKLTKGTVLYICVGGAGGAAWGSKVTCGGGYNGGGGGRSGGDGITPGTGGGGATHIATTNRGVLSNYNSYRNEVLIVAGGGGGSGPSGRDRYGGSGGGTYGGNASTGNGGGGGTQSAGGNSIGAYSGAGFGYGATTNTYIQHVAGGGGGLYGGGSGVNAGGGGGSGYIGGVPSFTYNGTTYAPSMSNGQCNDYGYAKITLVALTKIYKLNVDGSVVQTVYLDGVALEQIKFDDVSVFGNP